VIPHSVVGAAVGNAFVVVDAVPAAVQDQLAPEHLDRPWGVRGMTVCLGLRCEAGEGFACGGHDLLGEQAGLPFPVAGGPEYERVHL
jgi:hypothetical protein